MKTASDELRNHTAQNRFRFERRDFDLLQQMHVPQKKLSELLTSDSKRFQDAVNGAARAGGLRATAKSEPVRFVFDLMLKKSINASQAAAELGVTPDALEELKGAGGKLRSLVVAMEGRGVKREEFLAEFPTLVDALRLGEYRQPKPLRLPIFDPTSQTGEPLIDDRNDDDEFAIRLRTDTGRTRFRLGDKLTLLVEADRDCFVTLVQVDPDGKLALLVPNGYSPKPVRLRKGERLRLPAVRDNFDLVTTKPVGRYVIRAIATPQPLALAGITPQVLKDQVFPDLGRVKDTRSKFTPKPRGQANQPPIIPKPLAQQFNRSDWVTADLVLTTTK